MHGIPLAWLQLSAEKLRLTAAVAGIAFAVMLMFMQLGFRDALISSATLVHDRLNGEVVLISPLYEYLMASRSFSDERLYQALGTDGVEAIAPIYFSGTTWKNPVTGLDYRIEILGVDPGSETLQIPAVIRDMEKLGWRMSCSPTYVAGPRSARSPRGLPNREPLSRR